tara:strand:+ start:342 stop:788 length:447 start_codon:yes stop_codon:yes gene_type:complete
MVTKEKRKLSDGIKVPDNKIRLEDRCINCHSLFFYYRRKKKNIRPKSFCNEVCRKQFKSDRSIIKNYALFKPYESFTPSVKMMLALIGKKRASNHLRKVHHITNGVKVYEDQLYRGKWSWSDSKGRVISDWERNEKVRAKEKKWHYKN